MPDDVCADCGYRCGDSLDAEAKRILSMSDEQIIAEATAEGIDIHAEAEKCRAIFERALANVKRT